MGVLCRMYGDVLDFDEEKRCIPEWAEDVLYYIVRKVRRAHACLDIHTFAL
jgi:hypothetical protein